MSLYKWSSTAAANATADGSINWAEGQAPSSVNDSARAMMAATAKFRNDVSGGVITGGSSTAYTIASNQSFDTLAHLSGNIICIIPHTDSGAAPTLNVDSLGAFAINMTSTVAVATGALKAATPYHLVYFNATTEFILINPFIAAMLGTGVITTTMLAAAAVTYAKIQNVAAGTFLGGNLTGASAAAPTENVIPFGQCRLAKNSTNLVLSPYKGNLLTMNSVAVQIPDAGVALSTSGLSLSTLYYIYAFMNSGTMTLEASATAYATQAGTGVTIKSGDATRTLVGLARTDGSIAWQDTAALRFTRSYFNDPGINMLGSFSASRTTSSGTFAELNTEIRLQFICWTGEVVRIEASGSVSPASGANATTSIGIDGTTAEDTFCNASTGTANNFTYPFGIGIEKSGLAEGFHFATLLGFSSGGTTASWTGSGSASARSAMRGFAKL